MKSLTLPLVICVVLLFASLSESQVANEDLYKVGIDDVVQIKVLDNPNLGIVTTISSDGSINYPFLGTVYIKGMSVTEIEKEITKRLSEGYVKYPVVTVSLVKSMSRTILTYGEIRHIGKIPFDDNMTIVRTMSIAGGVNDAGKYGKVRVRRKKGGAGEYKDIIEFWLDNGIIEDKEVEEMFLQPDDILIVERNKTFLIQGEVASRGRVVLEKGMTVLSAILQAGGVSENGRYGKVRVRRKAGESGEYKDLIESQLDDGIIEDKEVEEMFLQPDDILIIERNKTFFIYGEVNKTGEFLLDTDMTVFKAITLAGGFTKWGSGSRVKILRPMNGHLGLETIKVNIEDVLDGDASADIYLKPKDVIVVSTGIF